MSRILVVDDDAEIRETMASLLRRQKIEHDLAGDIASTKKLLAEHSYNVVLLDVRLPDGNGLDLIGGIKEIDNHPEIIILTGKGDPEGAELAIQGGVWDYLVKPAGIKEINLSINRALKYHLEKSKSVRAKALDMNGLISVSAEMKSSYDTLAQAAASGSNVLVTGETGCGKELFARTIHKNSSRADKPFVVVDCAALTETLVESTLFGHKKGAFTGAESDRQGLVQQADKGVLFLDEVGELPLSIQKSLLRVLQERKFRPVGDTKEYTSDFKLISATNRNLEAMVESQEFRSDLLYRLKTIQLALPPLRKRPEDIKPLAMFRVDQLCQRYGLPNKGFGSDFFEMLTSYAWPGNVRELFNVLERAFVASGQGKTLYAMHLPKELRIQVTKAQLKPVPDPTPDEAVFVPADRDGEFPSLKKYKSMAEKDYIIQLINKSAGDVKEMIRLSGLSRSHFYALLKKHGVSI